MLSRTRRARKQTTLLLGHTQHLHVLFYFYFFSPSHATSSWPSGKARSRHLGNGAASQASGFDQRSSGSWSSDNLVPVLVTYSAIIGRPSKLRAPARRLPAPLRRKPCAKGLRCSCCRFRLGDGCRYVLL